jgi:DNA-binding MarR family transcriptional regulator
MACVFAYSKRMLEEPIADQLLPVDTIASRWGVAVDAGFVAVPNALLRAQDKLGLSPTDVVVLLNILMHWWHRDRLPRPRTTAIAKRSGIGHRTVQRSLSKLEKQGLLQRNRIAKDGVEYCLDGLRDQLAIQAQNDVWYRPELQAASPSSEIGAGAGFQNPIP